MKPETIDSVISPVKGMDILSKNEVSQLLDNSQNGLYELFRNCALAVLNSGVAIDDSKQLFEMATNGSVLAVIAPSDSTREAAPDLFIFALLGDFHGYYKGYSQDLLKDKSYISWAILKAGTLNDAGRVTLKSDDPKSMPKIDFHYFEEGSDEHGKDLEAVVNGVELTRGISEATGKLIQSEEIPGGRVMDRDDIRQFVRDEAWGHHACGTCAMKPADQDGVIDSKFRVYGTENLRIVDASIFPRIPGYFILTSIYMAAEKAAEDIVADA